MKIWQLSAAMKMWQCENNGMNGKYQWRNGVVMAAQCQSAVS